MKHRVALRKLGRSGAHRRALFRNQVTQLIEHERIETTVAKAKDLRRIADRMVSLGKKNTVTSLRSMNAYVQTKDAARKLMVDIVPRFESRPGGYTRVLKTGFRKGDCAPTAVIEWSDTEKTILTAEQLEKRAERKRKRAERIRGLADALD